MENYILYRYKEWLKTREGSFLKQLTKIPVGAIVLLSFLLVTLIAMLVVVLVSKGEGDYMILSYILMGAEVTLGIIITIYSEKILISHSKKNFVEYKTKCNELGEFLIEHGLTIDFVPRLIESYNDRISEIEEMIKHKHEAVNKFMEMLLIPISAIILGAMLDKDISVSDTLELGILGMFIVFLIYGVIVFTMFLYDVVMRMPEDKYRQIAADLQSFLDFKECEKPSEQISSKDLIQQT